MQFGGGFFIWKKYVYYFKKVMQKNIQSIEF